MENTRSLTLPISIILAGLFIGAGIYFSTTNQPQTSVSRPDSIENIRPITEDDFIRGNPNANLAIIEYSDLECPFCKQFHQTLLDVMDNQGRSGEVAWVYRHFPLDSLHRKARVEAHASECVAELGGDTAFWAFIDEVFEKTPSNDGLDLALLPEIASRIGVDRELFETCHESGRHNAEVERDFQDAIAAGGIGTPHVTFVTAQGHIYSLESGTLPQETLESVIEFLLEATRTNQDYQLTRNQLHKLLGYN